ncbi:MAG: serine/threonine protein kinase-related protein [Planctomycetota bacterium]|nr:MAG: serine/threonine protein kinase-related protein [Planctomycetota bacterium]
MKLNHPHVCSILDVGDHDGAPFFVMPFISGGSLRSRQKNELGLQKPLKPESLRRWLLEMARALDFIHSKGCVHRDVKPDNILFDEHGHPFLSDFGLSKILPTGEEDDPRQTAAGAIVGTPLFCAPELILAQPFDGRADQYSLALTVYDTLAGTNPFEGPNSSATLVNQTAMQPPPLMELNPSVTPAVWRCVLKGLAKSANDRYGSCVEFAEATLAAVNANVSTRSSGMHSTPMSSSRRSSSNTTSDTAIHEREVGKAARGTPGKTAPSRYVISARKPIVKAKTVCPSCAAQITLQPAFAGKKATCQKCQCRLLIAPDFSELLQLELVTVRDKDNTSESRREANPSRDSANTTPGEFELVLGSQVFGWKLSRKAALGIVGVLALFLLSMTVFFTWQASRSEQERLQERLREQLKQRVME